VQPPDRPTGTLLERSAAEVPATVREKIGFYLDSASALGRRTARMHLALAAPTEDPAFQAEPLTDDNLRTLVLGFREHAGIVFNALKASLPALPDDVVDQAALTLGQRRGIVQRFRGLEQSALQASLIRIHGDYHLGQVLWVHNDFVIVDFEGEASLPLAQRRLKQPALKDVAGMLRSLSYAAYAGLLAFSARRPEDYARLEPWAAFWEQSVSATYLAAYRQAAADAPFLPTRMDHFQALLDAFLMDKALRQLNHDLSSRPAWVRIPLQGILDLVR
jgi:maltose alpha-D-glucosyltransferase/alpha-amylase